MVNTYWQSNTILMLKELISTSLKLKNPSQEGVPDDFKYLALIESGLENVTSPAGAKGFGKLCEQPEEN